jgi:predicted nucleotidyltransferase component of viral defense system
VLKRAFTMFDSTKTGKIEKEKVRTILNTLGHTYDDKELEDLLEAEDVEGKNNKRRWKYIIYHLRFFLLPINLKKNWNDSCFFPYCW